MQQSTAENVKRQIAAGHLEEAESELQAVALADPQQSVVFEQLATIAYLKRDHHAARTAANRAIELEPRSTPAYVILARLALRESDFAQAQAAAELAARFSPQDFDTLKVSARIFVKQGHFDKAVDGWRKVIAVRPSDSRGHLELARALKKHGRLEEAIEALNGCLALAPLDAEALQLKAELLTVSHKFEELCVLLIQLLETDSSAALAYYPALLNASELEGVAKFWAAARGKGLELGNDFSDKIKQALDEEMAKAERQGDFIRAARLIEVLAQSQPFDAEIQSRRTDLLAKVSTEGARLAQEGRHADARRTLEFLIGLAPHDAGLRRSNARLLADMGDYAAAAQAWLRCGEFDPQGDERLQILAAIAKIENPTSALVVLAEVLTATPPEDEESYGAIRQLGAAAASKVNRALAGSDFPTISDRMLEQAAALAAWSRSTGVQYGVVKSVINILSEQMRAANEARSASAEFLATRILRIDGGRIETLRTLANIYARDHRPDQAIEALNRLLARDPQNEEYLLKVARIYRSAMRYDEGIAATLSLLEYHPEHADGQQLLHEMLYRHVR